jgi:mannose-6-phosphate isomerase-like protein (cupin superfamily)
VSSFPQSAARRVPAGQGPVTWFNGDIYRIPLAAGETGGAIGIVEATVPPGGGPIPHVHERSDETFYVITGAVEFLLDQQTFMVHPEDVVFVPRGVLHRFHNSGIRPATLLFIYTPGGPEGLFIEGGDPPIPGTQVQPWGPERIDDRLLGLLAKYDTALPPAAAMRDFQSEHDRL